MGDPLGSALITMMNSDFFPTVDRGREKAIMGDPTLRILNSKGPANVTITTANGKPRLTWAGGDSAVAHVYRGASPSGPFQRLTSSTPVASPYDDTQWNSNLNQLWYMVRSAPSTKTGSGTYQTLSQGFLRIYSP
jgi:hypothetical protein